MEESTTSYPSPDTTNPDWQKTYGFKSSSSGVFLPDDRFDETSGEIKTSEGVTVDAHQYYCDLHSRVQLLTGIAIIGGALIGVLCAGVFFDMLLHKR